MKYVTFIILLLIGVGCSPSKRLARIQKKHPELFKDISDTVIINQTKYDTFTNIETFLDTFEYFDTITKTKVVTHEKTRLIYRTIKQTIPQRMIITKKQFINCANSPIPKGWIYLLAAFIIFVLLWKTFH